MRAKVRKLVAVLIYLTCIDSRRISIITITMRVARLRIIGKCCMAVAVAAAVFSCTAIGVVSALFFASRQCEGQQKDYYGKNDSSRRKKDV